MTLPPEMARIFRFGLVGIVATTVHMSVVLLAETHTRLPALIIHLMAFLSAFSLSFFGHYLYTFRSDRHWQKAIVRFLMVSLLALALSSGFLKLASAVGTPDLPSLLFAAVSVPVISYMLNKRFTF